MTEYFYLMAPDINAFFYSDGDIAAGRLCLSCKSRLVDFEDFFPRQLPVSRLQKDWGFTYDNQIVFSSRARDTLRDWEVDCTFYPLDRDGQLFTAVFHDVFEFAPQVAGTRYLDHCEACGNFGSIVGVTPVGINGTVEHNKPLYRSDLEIGSGNPKSPVLIISRSFQEFLGNRHLELGFRHVTSS